MALEYVEITAGTGTKVQVDTVDTDKQVQIVKIMHGADGANDGIVDDASPLPVVDAAGSALLTTIDADTGAISLGTGGTADAAATAGSTGSINAKLRLATSQLDSIKTAVETLDNAISGSEMQVDIVGALPAGTAAIGKLAANSGVDIGDVDVTSVPTDPFGANADAASVSTSISAKLKAIATALGVTALDLGSGTGGSRTLRVFLDTASALPTSGYSSSASFTPAAASHTAGDCVGAAAEFTSMGPSAGRVVITSATLEIDSASAQATAWRVHLYNVTPTSAIADDGVWNYADTDRSQYLGYIDLPSTATDIGSNQWVEVTGLAKQVKLSGTSVFGYLQNLTTLTTAAVVHKVTLHAVAV